MENNKEKNIGSGVLKFVFIYIVMYISYLSIYMSRQSLSVATPELKNQLIMNAFQIGVLGTVFSVTYSVGRLINGRIGDKIQPKYMICIGLFIIFITNFCFGLFLPFVFEAILWGLNAYGQSMLWGPILRILAKYVPKKHLTRLTSIIATSISMGTMCGILICTKVIVSAGLKYAFFVPAFIALVCCILVFILVGKTEIVKNPQNSNNQQKSSENTPKLGEILRNKLLLSTLIPAMLHGIVKENINLWLTLYFVTQFDVDLSDSMLFMFAIPIVGIIGRLLYPSVYKLLKKNEFNVELFGFVIVIIASGILTFIPKNDSSPIGIIILASICLGLINAAINLINHSVLTMIPLKFAKINSSSTASGIIDFSVYLGAAGGSFIYGLLFDKGIDFSWMYISWIAVSVISIGILIYSNKKKFLDIL